MVTIRINCGNGRRWGISSVIASRTAVLVLAGFASVMVFHHPRASAQWWHRAPADFEECADAANKAATSEEKTAALAKCNSKFAGRRKPGGGYTYYDFMQNRSFDIAGPNPTPEEQRKIDQQYTEFLDQERRNSIAAAAAARQQQQQQAQPVQPVTLRSEPEKIPLPVEAPNKPQSPAGADVRARAKGNCARRSFSCEWPRLSEGIKDLKKILFGSSSNKAKRG
jgi:hypothetical protein